MSIARHLIPLVLLLINAGTCVKIGTRSGASERAAWKLVNSPPLATLDTKRLNIATLGHRGLYDDFAAVWAVQFLADNDLPKKASADETYKALKSITRHSPKLESLYLLSCFVLALDYHRPELCESLSLDGLKAFPNSWRIPMTQGFVTAFEQNDNLKAAAFYQLAASRPGSPSYVARLAEKMTAKGFANGQDLNETVDMLKQVPGGTKIIELLRQRGSVTVAPPPNPTPGQGSATTRPPLESTPENASGGPQ